MIDMFINNQDVIYLIWVWELVKKDLEFVFCDWKIELRIVSTFQEENISIDYEKSRDNSIFQVLK